MTLNVYLTVEFFRCQYYLVVPEEYRVNTFYQKSEKAWSLRWTTKTNKYALKRNLIESLTPTSIIDDATLLERVISSIIALSPLPSFVLETNPNRKDPTSGNINQRVLFSLLVIPLRVGAAFGTRRWTVTPPYKNFLNLVSNEEHSAASSFVSEDKKENGG
mmetsp:Transcript_7519/g.15522  ORF Transcript_7519/g.15522 Transcript_7519/m.15522 type:complete len:161 (-) Transcript_7519:2343-2825(-)